MRVVQVSHTDQMGARFNGLDLHLAMRDMGYESHMLVWSSYSGAPYVSQFCNVPGLRRLLGTSRHSQFNAQIREFVRQAATKTERLLSVQNVLYPASYALMRNHYFQAADLIHYQLIHTGFFSLAALPLLTKKKPSVWTLHDPWAITGHCVHPFDCQRWKIGCGSCPDLKVEFQIKRDNTHFNWKTKKKIYERSNLEIVVSSQWMKSLVDASPLMSNFKMHVIPFGIDLSLFRPKDAALSKKKLGVRPGNFVIALRSTWSPYKGTEYVVEALKRLKGQYNLTILTFNEKGRFEEFLGKHQIIELGWLTNQEEIVDAYNAADVFLTPSRAESFGLMAVEAMSCGKPCIIFDNTALSEITFAPQCGIAVPMMDAQALAYAIDDIADNTNKRLALGELARSLAETHYDWNTHVDRMIALYQEVISRRRREGLQGESLKETECAAGQDV